MANGELWRMGDMFQLSIELYDTKDKKLVWSDRWQEKWDNLPSIKESLSDGLLKALDTKPKVKQKVETTNPEAYEFYLKAKHKYGKRENKDDIEIARGLLKKALELDDNLIYAKNLLGTTYSQMGDYDEAMEIYTSSLKQAEKIGDKRGIETSLSNIGVVYDEKGDLDTALDYYERALAIAEEISDKVKIGNNLMGIGGLLRSKGNYDTALDYHERSLAIFEELGDKVGIVGNLSNIGILYYGKGDYDTALDYHERALAIREEIGDKRGIGTNLSNFGVVYYEKGDYDTALDYYERALAICEELGDKNGMGISLNNIGEAYSIQDDYDTALDYYERALKISEKIGDEEGIAFCLYNFGILYYNSGNYDKAQEYLAKSLSIQINIGYKDLELGTTTYFYLTYRHLGKEYDINEIHTLIKAAENIEFELNLRLYELLEDKSHLETAFNQVKEKADNLESDVQAKFLSYPIPKAIVEEWEKVK
jgi:tetratricopeptide (TPR) repeat protein